jgi:alkylation response protein AidB-like acyl-CoA dehydrogenase
MLFNDDQLAIRDLARRFSREKLAPHYQARDKSGALDRSLLREMGELGLMGVDLPEAFGGLGAPSPRVSSPKNSLMAILTSAQCRSPCRCSARSS